MDIADIAGRIVDRGASLSKLLDVSDTNPHGGESQPELPGAAGGRESDGSFPLLDARWEAFACAIAGGTVEWRAYMDHVSSRCSRPTASQQASRGMRRGDVKARVSFLIRTRNQQLAAAATGVGPAPVPGKPMSREAKIREVEALLKDPSLSATDRLRAIEQHNRMTAGDSGESKMGIHKIDPADLVEYLRLAAEQGQDVAVMAQEAAGEGGKGKDPAERFGGDSQAETNQTPQSVGGA